LKSCFIVMRICISVQEQKELQDDLLFNSSFPEVNHTNNTTSSPTRWWKEPPLMLKNACMHTYSIVYDYALNFIGQLIAPAAYTTTATMHSQHSTEMRVKVRFLLVDYSRHYWLRQHNNELMNMKSSRRDCIFSFFLSPSPQKK